MSEFMGKAPGQYEDEAREHERQGRWADAAKSWWLASARSIGHERAERYYAEHVRCLKLAKS